MIPLGPLLRLAAPFATGAFAHRACPIASKRIDASPIAPGGLPSRIAIGALLISLGCAWCHGPANLSRDSSYLILLAVLAACFLTPCLENVTPYMSLLCDASALFVAFIIYSAAETSQERVLLAPILCVLFLHVASVLAQATCDAKRKNEI